MQCCIQVATDLIRGKGRLVAGGIEINRPLPVYISIEGHQLEISIIEKDAGIVLGELPCLREAGKIHRTQRLMAVSMPD